MNCMRKKYKMNNALRNNILRELYQYYENKRQLEEMEDEEGASKGNETGITPKNKVSRPTENQALMALSRKSSRYLLAVERKVRCITNVYNRLNESEQELFDLIFKEGYSQKKAEQEGKASYDTYYNTHRKIVLLTAFELGEIDEI